ncbi:cellulose-binding protein, partial [Streptomyces sp. CHB19.2]|nr:cellulose-binding protein [Streptomyces sp. CHB19.2]
MRVIDHLPLRALLVLTALLLPLGLTLTPPFAPRANAAPYATPVRVMPLGDSITGSPGCWRALLWNR